MLSTFIVFLLDKKLPFRTQSKVLLFVFVIVAEGTIRNTCLKSKRTRPQVADKQTSQSLNDTMKSLSPWGAAK